MQQPCQSISATDWPSGENSRLSALKSLWMNVDGNAAVRLSIASIFSASSSPFWVMFESEISPSSISANFPHPFRVIVVKLVRLRWSSSRGSQLIASNLGSFHQYACNFAISEITSRACCSDRPAIWSTEVSAEINSCNKRNSAVSSSYHAAISSGTLTGADESSSS